jgi:hypothetical protein
VLVKSRYRLRQKFLGFRDAECDQSAFDVLHRVADLAPVHRCLQR